MQYRKLTNTLYDVALYSAGGSLIGICGSIFAAIRYEHARDTKDKFGMMVCKAQIHWQFVCAAFGLGSFWTGLIINYRKPTLLRACCILLGVAPPSVLTLGHTYRVVYDAVTDA